MRAYEFIFENVDQSRLLEDSKLDQQEYMAGKCMTLAAALNKFDPNRFKIGATIMYSGFPSVNDIGLMANELEDMKQHDPEEYHRITTDTRYWGLVHAYNHDAVTNEWIDARGRHPTKQSLMLHFSAIDEHKEDKFPLSQSQLAKLCSSCDYNDDTDEWTIKRGRHFAELYFTQDKLTAALHYAEDKLGIDLSKNHPSSWSNDGQSDYNPNAEYTDDHKL